MVEVRTSTCEFVEVGNIIQSITGNEMRAFLLSKDSQVFLLGHLPEVCEQAMIGLKDFTGGGGTTGHIARELSL